MRHTVLLVDDDKNLLASVQRVLRREPYRTLIASDHDSALEVVRRHSVDAAVVDYHMPVKSGIDLLARLRQEQPQIIRLMLTGESNLDVAIRAINVGEIFRFIRKPCESAQLITAIRQALLQRELESQSRALLKKFRHQSALLKRLESDNPGIAFVERDIDGAIIIDDAGLSDLSSLVEALRLENEAEPAAHD